MATLGLLMGLAVAAGLLVVASGFVMVGGLRLLVTDGSRSAGRELPAPDGRTTADRPSDAWHCPCGAVNDGDFEVCRDCATRLPSRRRRRAEPDADSGFES